MRRLLGLTLTCPSVRSEGESGSASAHARIVSAHKVLLAAAIPISARIHLYRLKPQCDDKRKVKFCGGGEDICESGQHSLLQVLASRLRT